MDKFDLRKYVSDRTLLEDQPTKSPMKRRKRIYEAKTSIHKKLAEIENLGKAAALEIKMKAVDEEIATRSERLSMLDENSELSELMNPQKVREFKKEIKLLEKQKVKYERLLAKESGKDKAEMPSEDKEVVENGMDDDLEETGYGTMYDEDDNDSMNEEDIGEDKVKGSNVRKDTSDDDWEVLSGKTGKPWPQDFKTKKSAQSAIKAYHASKG